LELVEDLGKPIKLAFEQIVPHTPKLYINVVCLHNVRHGVPGLAAEADNLELEPAMTQTVKQLYKQKLDVPHNVEVGEMLELAEMPDSLEKEPV